MYIYIFFKKEVDNSEIEHQTYLVLVRGVVPLNMPNVILDDSNQIVGMQVGSTPKKLVMKYYKSKFNR